jgi:hypothetical protein
MHPLEVIGLGGQMVIYATHESTGKPYQWPDESLVELDISQLPVITEKQAMAWLEAAFKLVPEELRPKRLSDGNVGLSIDRISNDPTGTYPAVKSALAFIPNNDVDGTGWITMLNAIKAAIGEQGRELWIDWSKSSAKSGASGKSNTAERRWATARPSGSAGAGLIYYQARQRGWIPEAGLILNGNAAKQAAQPNPGKGLIERYGPEGDAAPLARVDDKAPLWVDDGDWNPAAEPARPWLAPGYLLRGCVTVVSGPGGVSKSSLTLAWAVAMVLGRTFHRFEPKVPGKVLLLNCEDDKHEQRRRLEAIFHVFGIAPNHPAIKGGSLIRVGVNGVGTLVQRDQKTGEISQTDAMRELEAMIAKKRPDMIILDPLVELHNSEENDNPALRAIVAYFRAIAGKYDAAVVLVHHARKGAGSSPGDPDTLRGASSIVGAARIVLTVTGMQLNEAAAFGMSEAASKHYLRVDGAKSNHAPPGAAEWFHRQGFIVGSGDEVAALEPWVPSEEAAPEFAVDAILTAIAAGSPGGMPWSPQKSTSLRSVKNLFDEHGVIEKTAQKKLLDQLLKKHGVVIAWFQDNYRNAVQGLRTKAGEPAYAEWTDTTLPEKSLRK